MILPLFIHLATIFSTPEAVVRFQGAVVRTGDRATPVERRVAQLLKTRLNESARIAVRVESESEAMPPKPGELLILLGMPGHHDSLSILLKESRIESVTDADPGPEGFLLRTFQNGDQQIVVAAGADERGTLYAAGEFLRQTVFEEDEIVFPFPLEVRTAPSFEVRGTQFGQSWVAKRLGKVRDWTEEETERVILDYVLAGANVFSVQPGPMFDFLKSYGLMTQGNLWPNRGDGPPEWQAKESIGREGYLCPSVSQARAALLQQCEDFYRTSPTFDLVRAKGGDGGGCECDLCDPYGETCIHLLAEMAEIIHKYHPETRIFFTNQKFDDEDDMATFRYLQEKPRDWLWAFGYGPGSDAMSWQPGHRQTHRMDLFRYPGFGPFGRYCQEIIRELPPRHKLVFFNEITHWRYSQHGYIQMYPRADRNGDQPPHWNHFIYERRPDQALTMVYDRLTFYAWPRYYHWVFNQLHRYGVGDITHSSGHHDHFNQWMWQRLLWAPQSSVEEVVGEYCRTWFGRDAAPLMAQALFQLEENLEENPEKPITDKEGIDRYYDLVSQAGDRIPRHLMEKNWLWREYMQKGALDQYVKHSVQQQTDLEKRIKDRIARAFETDDLASLTEEVLPWFDQIDETVEMRRLREEAGRLGEESNAIFGVRNEGYFNLEHDFIGLGWMKRQLERARGADGSEKRELLWMLIHYDDPGEGGFYDNCGTFNPCPNLVHGYPFDHGQPYVSGMLSEANLPSQKSMSYTQDEEQGVTFHYRDLDPQAEYRVRFTLARPWHQDRYAMRMNQKSQSIYADEFLLAKELELPERMSDFFTFEIPGEAVEDGELTIRLEKAPDVASGPRVEREIWRNCGGWGTIVSEVWLMREDSLPWGRE